ncbi:MAG TPA: PEP-CTERM sorting domain-containing protein [Lacipirellulaceae bacterium]|nr:PEP-CTERM sorting domain-containing protein [Lacipirellulaceae bacterium]
MQYRTWSGPNGGALQTASNWSSPTAPNRYWSAVVANNGTSAAIAHVASDVTTLGIEVKGQSAMQVVNVHAGKTLTGLNEVRVGNHGRIDLAGGTVSSSRWTNIKSGGEVVGQGTMVGDVYNEGTVSPGRKNDTPAWPVAEPPALPPNALSTGVVNAATFDFTGIQDDVPINQTSTISPYLELSHGLDFGPSVGPRWTGGGTDAGNELNAIGFTASSLTQAITNGDYITFTVDPIEGAATIPSSVSFQLWRNGGAAAKNYAILSSVDGFTSAEALIQATYVDSGTKDNHASAQHTLTANLPSIADAIDGPIEYRLYAWGATDPRGNTHVNAATLSAKFVAVPSLEFDFAGVQSQAPLTALKRQDASVSLTSGLNFGPGLSASNVNNTGNEFNVAGFSTGTSEQSALDGNDYLTFSVQPISGMAMYLDSASFTLWRQSSGSASDYALFSNVDGFASGQELTQFHLTTTGSASALVLRGSFSSPDPTTDAVEFRLYAWGAATSSDNTHITAASMRARFASVVDVPIDPTGSLTVQGDFYHLAGGQIDIDLGGHSAGVDYDVINVLGKVDLEGDLRVALADVGGSPFAPSTGDSFQILTATQGITGQFANVNLPQLGWDQSWSLNYSSSAVTLNVVVSGDFNHDGFVNSADYIVWRKNNGSQADYNIWRSSFGQSIGTGAGALGTSSASVPEPATFFLLALASIWVAAGRRRRPSV